MKMDELRKMSADELREALMEAKEERFNLRFQVATNQLDNTARLRTVKKDIARILTVMRERELESASAGSADAPATAGKESA
ncbi:MAG TPA: 50S ribosomal protein L29 [Acidimicrobiia bacterium]|jgi:large subunit ribosomal protein L29|nr:50S ribosomal protein L29 [Acidimicrobiia bacterium]